MNVFTRNFDAKVLDTVPTVDEFLNGIDDDAILNEICRYATIDNINGFVVVLSDVLTDYDDYRRVMTIAFIKEGNYIFKCNASSISFEANCKIEMLNGGAMFYNAGKRYFSIIGPFDSTVDDAERLISVYQFYHERCTKASVALNQALAKLAGK